MDAPTSRSASILLGRRRRSRERFWEFGRGPAGYGVLSLDQVAAGFAGVRRLDRSRGEASEAIGVEGGGGRAGTPAVFRCGPLD
jgi:hypothetical protein